MNKINIINELIYDLTRKALRPIGNVFLLELNFDFEDILNETLKNHVFFDRTVDFMGNRLIFARSFRNKGTDLTKIENEANANNTV